MRAAATFCAAALLAAWSASSRAECEQGVRDTTAAEQAAIQSVLDAVKRALPPAPQGWVIDSDDDPAIANDVCREAERKPWSYDRSRTYRKREGGEQRQAAIASAQEQLTSDLASKQPRIEAIQARMQELGAALADAVQKGDSARMKAIGEENKKLSQEYQALLAEGNSGQRYHDAARGALADTVFTIQVTINPESDGLPEDAERVAPPPGAAAAARYDTSTNTRQLTTEVIAFGRWRQAADGSPEVVPRNGPPQAPHGITVSVSAAESRLDQVIRSIDLGAVAKLLAP